MKPQIFSKLTSIVSSQLAMIKQLFTKIYTLSSKITQKVTKMVRDFIQTLMKNPADKKDYIKIGKFYVSKKLFLFICIGVAFFIYFIVQFAYPWADGRLWTASMRVNSKKYSTFTGKARVKDSVGVVIYEGQMQDGSITGYGKQYDAKGNLVYIGDFVDSEYSGKGELYSEGVMIYRGAFAQNLFEGQGEMYDQKGNHIYSGNFALGQRSGKGISYYPSTGAKEYYGEFANDLREGKGIFYTEDGNYTLYEGDFSAGLYSGSGKLYENGKLKYQGAFVSGQYEGEGTLYDVETGNVLYQGAFVAGKYEGTGTLYDPKTAKIIYEGEFLAGQRQGEGASYDKLGAASYNGSFKDDSIDHLTYLGAAVEDITAQFGKERYRTTVDDRLILTYTNLDTAVIFKADEEGAYTCEKMIMGLRDGIFGLKATSSQEDIRNVMGQAFSSIEAHRFAKYYDTAFNQLSINLSSKKAAPSDKFIMDNYFVRFYYNDNKTEIKAVEVSQM